MCSLIFLRHNKIRLFRIQKWRKFSLISVDSVGSVQDPYDPIRIAFGGGFSVSVWMDRIQVFLPCICGTQGLGLVLLHPTKAARKSPAAEISAIAC